MSEFKISSQSQGLHSTEVAFLLLTQQPRVQFSAFPKNFIWNFLLLLGFIDGTGRGQRLENVNQTHLVRRVAR